MDTTRTRHREVIMCKPPNGQVCRNEGTHKLDLPDGNPPEIFCCEHFELAFRILLQKFIKASTAQPVVIVMGIEG